MKFVLIMFDKVILLFHYSVRQIFNKFHDVLASAINCLLKAYTKDSKGHLSNFRLH